MVGEHIGNQKFQHLIKYSRQTLIFYAIVDNDPLKDEVCWLPETSKSIFEKYGFDYVTMQSLGVFEDYDGLCDCLEENFMQTATASISEEEEGAVLYLV